MGANFCFLPYHGTRNAVTLIFSLIIAKCGERPSPVSKLALGIPKQASKVAHDGYRVVGEKKKYTVD